MNIEELTKSQLLLLTILVTFVTSIATGILTVSLLDQAPPVVTQTVNQIVERTIKTVAPSLPVTVVKTTAPAPPSSEDLVTGALAAQNARTVLIYKTDQSTSTAATAIGTYLPSARAVATAAADILPKQAIIEFPDGLTKPVTLTRENKSLAIYGFSDSATLPQVADPKLVSAQDLKLGETVLAIRGDGSATTGIVAQVTTNGVYTTLPSVGAGVGAVDLSGDLVGIATGNAQGLFISADVLHALLIATSTTATTTATNTPIVSASAP
ncbi:MAG: hypothetical protein B7X04_02950 [Parcubacteria group bacterium 21-54-25]|nr:MAG: hypothetical protein B7X04_02950 [Parcubacteria group bacterium 21-54-25]HQU07915.1 hypothetical protein [Candidatus Paceibacterota bacterium]